MWEVAWTDANRTLVGEHRERKDKAGNEKDKKSLTRQSVSTTSSKGSAYSAFSRLRTKAGRKSSSSKGSSKEDSPAAPVQHSSPESLSTDVTDVSRIEMSGGLSKHSPCDPVHSVSHTSVEIQTHIPILSNTDLKDDDILDNKRQATIPTIPRQVTPSKSTADDVFAPDGKEKENSQRFESSEQYTRSRPEKIPRVKAIYPPDLQSPVTKSFNSPARRLPRSPPRSYTLKPEAQCPGTVKQLPPSRSPLQTSPKATVMPNSINDTAAWRSPQEWAEESWKSPSRLSTQLVPGAAPVISKAFLSDQSRQTFDNLIIEVQEMTGAEPWVALEKLKAPLSSRWTVEEQRQLDDEKKTWMISVLHNLDRKEQLGLNNNNGADPLMPEPLRQSKQQKILAFYDSKSRYLAALWPGRAVHHISDAPLTTEVVPNLYPIYNEEMRFQVPELTSQFNDVYSMVLPSFCREPELPVVLHNINKSLKPGGVFNLLVIDPIPNIEALGEKMRAWLLKHLLRNLQRQSRCLNPSGSLPTFLGQASLRGPGSTLTTTQFFANPQSVRCYKGDDEITAKEAGGDKEIRAELRSHAGRMLWREVYGEFVTADDWWWNDAACMQECIDLGTFWEYHSIRAVKAT
ncbi:hypothetical protein QQS21_009366 [Conoideocrella luteorostrata]|uniref:Uncharacterized protein n=1 Tax=Conoideocrella luteorostrata TaxID=1105319 RepID=A0AAJ0CH42_9HYPO|nr:hypothetical protein QQS21_009366 [Conoideocrella luteorostrata]